MKMFTFWKQNKLNSDIKLKELLSEIYSTEEFKNIISRERIRCDRSGSFFSLVTFNLSGKSEKAIVQLMEILNTRGTRTIDEVGMFGRQNIGVCLHDTDKTGALSFANTIHERIISATGQNFSYNVYVYPTDWRGSGNGNGHLNNLHKNNGYNKQSKLNLNRSLFLRDQSENVFVDNGKSKNSLIKVSNYTSPHWKRIMDITLSVLALILLSPLFLITILFIKILSPGPSFFKQERVGYMGKTFIMIKFRSMKVGNNTSAHKEYFAELINSTKNGGDNEKKPMTKQDNLNNMIPFGRMFRRLCIDELPQLINVLRGEMSLIGPRPPIPYEVEEYLNWHKGRFDVVPGITGLWQVSGKNRLTFDQMIRLDIKYSRQGSFWLDIKIILKTPFAIISQFVDSVKDTDKKMKGVIDYA